MSVGAPILAPGRVKAQPAGLLSGRLLIELHEDWNPGATKFTQGSLVSVRLADVLRDPAHLNPVVVFAPTADEFLNSSATTFAVTNITQLEDSPILAGRYFERFADHAVHVAENVVYLVTGQHPEEIADLVT